MTKRLTTYGHKCIFAHNGKTITETEAIERVRELSKKKSKVITYKPENIDKLQRQIV